MQLGAIVVVSQESRLNKDNISLIIHYNLGREIVVSSMFAIEILLRLNLRSLNSVTGPVNNSNCAWKHLPVICHF